MTDNTATPPHRSDRGVFHLNFLGRSKLKGDLSGVVTPHFRLPRVKCRHGFHPDPRCWHAWVLAQSRDKMVFGFGEIHWRTKAASAGAVKPARNRGLFGTRRETSRRCESPFLDRLHDGRPSNAVLRLRVTGHQSRVTNSESRLDESRITRSELQISDTDSHSPPTPPVGSPTLNPETGRNPHRWSAGCNCAPPPGLRGGRPKPSWRPPCRSAACLGKLPNAGPRAE